MTTADRIAARTVTGVMAAWLRVPVRAALGLMAAVILAASVAAFTESYRGLYKWAVRHSLTGFWAAVWPLQVDTFIVVGELMLFVGVACRWPRRYLVAAWAATAIGVCESVAGNIGHAPTHDLATRGTFAVPPLAAAGALFLGLLCLKAVISAAPKTENVAPVSAREVVMARSGERGYGAALAASARTLEADRKRREKADKRAGKERTSKPPRRPVNVRSRGRSKDAAIAALVSAPDMTGEELTRLYGGTDRTHRRWREDARELAAVAANGDGQQERRGTQ
jgi:hypothetical protein